MLDTTPAALDLSRPYVRWMIRRDLPEVLQIEAASFANPWSEEDFEKAMRQRMVIGMVAEYREVVSGYMVYENREKRIDLLTLGVKPAARHQGIGTSLVDKLKSKLSPHRRRSITASVSEASLGAQLFLVSQGFRAVEVIRGWYDDGRDAYVFRYRLDEVPLDDRMGEI